MLNLKEEFLKHTKGKLVLCAYMVLDVDYKPFDVLLKKGYSKEDLEQFLNTIEDYDSCWGGSEISGTIWYDNGVTTPSWSEWEYDHHYNTGGWKLYNIPAVYYKLREQQSPTL